MVGKHAKDLHDVRARKDRLKKTVKAFLFLLEDMGISFIPYRP